MSSLGAKRPPRGLRSLTVCALAVGCAGGPPPPTHVVPQYDVGSGRLVRLSYDSNLDGRPDMVASMEGRSVRVVEVDEDHDGRPDRWEHYAAEPGAAPGAPAEPRLVRVEHVTRRGEIIVRREIFEGGALIEAREDRDADGRDDRWEAYGAGGLSEVQIDTDADGRPDRRLTYSGDALAVR